MKIKRNKDINLFIYVMFIQLLLTYDETYARKVCKEFRVMQNVQRRKNIRTKKK